MQILFDYVPGMDLTLLGGTHTRADASTCATYVDKNGIVRTVAANVLRDGHYIGGVRHTLLEQARTDSALRSWDLTAGAWTGTASTALNAVGIDGVANHATTVSDISGAAIQARSQTIAIANDNATHAVQFWVLKDHDETRFPQIGAALINGTTVQRLASLNTATGVFVSANPLGTGTLTVRDGGLWWIVDLSLTNNTTGNTALRLDAYPAARTVIGGSDNVAAVGSIVVGDCQAELNATFCTSPLATAASVLTRASDALSFAFPFVPQELTMYVKFTERGTAQLSTEDGVVGLGSAVGGVPLFLLYHPGSGTYAATHHNGIAQVSSTAAAGVAYGDVVELRGILSSTGAVTLGQSINGAAEAVAANSGANALQSAWSAALLQINRNSGSAIGVIGIQRIIVVAGTKTMAEMRAPQSYIRFTDAEGTAYLSNEKPFPGNRFANWTPRSTPFGQRAARQSDGAETNFRLREDQSVSFEIPGIPSRLVDGVNPHETALRLKYHLENGGTCIVSTGDAIGATYSPCGILPGTTAELTLTDRRSIEFTLSLQLLNLAATPTRMVARFSEQ